MASERSTYCKRTIYTGNVVNFRSILEARWSYYLDTLWMSGEILSYEFEPEFFEFESIRHGTTRYKPDFRVIEKDGSEVWHETKGVLDGKSITKIRRFAEFFPDKRLWLIFDGICGPHSKTGKKQRTKIAKVESRIERVMDAKSIFRQLGINGEKFKLKLDDY